MYGKNLPSVKKHLVMQGLKIGKTFDQLPQEMKIAHATAEVYAIDSFSVDKMWITRPWPSLRKFRKRIFNESKISS